ncbi:MAG: hypothetical protein IPL35_12320 [Sphingobacteriales bacterium]|nr:hypothetical protein [Sphingobacteriales bacterium]
MNDISRCSALQHRKEGGKYYTILMLCLPCLVPQECVVVIDVQQLLKTMCAINYTV